METNYHIFSDKCKNKNSNNEKPIIETTPNLIKYELPNVVVLGDNDIVEGHPLTNHYYSNEDKEIMKTMLNYFIEFTSLCKTNPLFSKSTSVNKDRPHFSVTMDGNEKLRCIINNYQSALQLKKYYCVGFFGTKSIGYNSKLSEIIASDDALVSVLPEFPQIIGYVTIEKDTPESDELKSHLPNVQVSNYANIVIIENLDVINEWRKYTVHRDANNYLSPLYYHMVRIHNAEIQFPLGADNLLDYLEKRNAVNSDPSSFNLSFIRTKYYSFTSDGQVNFRGLREYSEITFASFLSPNAFEFYKKVVESIGKELNVPVKLIDVYGEMLVKQEQTGVVANMSKLPHMLMNEFNIDYAFMCGLAYVKAGDQILTPIVSPVRIEDHYQNKPVYFSNIITKHLNQINSIDNANSFSHNGKESFSGYQIFENYLKSSGGSSIDSKFKTINTGSHLKSIQSVLKGESDIASIDSTVLDTELLNGTISLDKDIKIIKTLGPYTIPPLVGKVSSIHYDKLNQIQSFLTSNEFTTSSSSILSNFNYKRFEKVNSSDFIEISKINNSNK